MPTQEKPYILKKSVQLSGNRQFFITQEGDLTYNLNWITVAYNKTTGLFSGQKMALALPMPEISLCNDIIGISNLFD
jgi:hypothetical protein